MFEASVCWRNEGGAQSWSSLFQEVSSSLRFTAGTTVINSECTCEGFTGFLLLMWQEGQLQLILITTVGNRKKSKQQTSKLVFFLSLLS